MELDGWKQRLADGLEAKGLSKREVSLASGNNPGYVHSLLVEGKEPTVAKLIAVCEAADLSVIHILFGVDMDRQTQEIVTALAGASARRRESLLNLLRDESAPEQPPSALERDPASAG